MSEESERHFGIVPAKPKRRSPFVVDDDFEGPATAKWTDGSWDVLRLGGRACPGIPSVEVKIQSNLDVKKPSGARGGKSSDRGDDPCGIEITIQIGEPDLPAFGKFARMLKPRARGDARDPLYIDHPHTAFWGITAVQVKSVSSPMPTSRDGWTVRIDCVEFVAEVPIVGKTADKPVDDSSAWQPFVDDEIAGPAAPSNSGAAEEGLGLPE